MKKIVTIIVTFFTVNLSYAQEIEKLSPSMELMKLLKFENTLINTSKLGFAPFFNQLRTNLYEHVYIRNMFYNFKI